MQDNTPTQKRKKLLLVDSSSVAVTTFYAKQGALYLDMDRVREEDLRRFLVEVIKDTFVRVLERLTFEQYTSVRMALESPVWAPVWRYEQYPDYKQALTRSDKPKVARALQPLLAAGCDELDTVKGVFIPGQEADDVISVMIHALSEEWLDENEVHIWSNDKDLHQLVHHDNIKIVGKKGVLITREQLTEEWGIDPVAVPLIKALAGDPSDNIPGLRGIGAKGAAKMLTPRIHRKPTPFGIDFENMPERKRLEILQLLPRIYRDEHLITLARKGELRPSSEYTEESE